MYMKRSLSLSIFLPAFLVLFFGGISLAEADTVVRTGDAVSLAADQVIEGDFYAAAGKVNLSGEIKEDAVVAAGQVTLNGSVGSNAFFIAGQTSVHGTVGDDLRIVSGEVTIAEPVMGDVLVLGGSLHILSTASVAGDVLVYAGEVVIEGSVGGDVIGTVGTLRIDAPIAGGVDVAVEQLTLGDAANVTGAVRYVSSQLVVQSPNSVVSGDLLRNDPVLPGTQTSIKAALIPLMIILFTILTWYLVSRKTLNAVIERSLTRSFRPVLYGVVSVVAVPIIFTLLFVSMIGTLVGFVLLFGFLMMLILSFVGGVAVIGQLLTNAFNQPVKGSSLLSLIAGVIALALLMLLPIIGQLAILVLTLVTLGAMIDLLFQTNKT
jgi:cytoskeletal protein CcmA (bactofilin family)